MMSKKIMVNIPGVKSDMYFMKNNTLYTTYLNKNSPLKLSSHQTVTFRTIDNRRKSFSAGKVILYLYDKINYNELVNTNNVVHYKDNDYHNLNPNNIYISKNPRKLAYTDKTIADRISEVRGKNWKLLDKYKGVKRKYRIKDLETGKIFIHTLDVVINQPNIDLRTHGFSKAERVVYNILEANDIMFEKSKHIVVNGRVHEFDFIIHDYKLMIECDGEQHFNRKNSWYSNDRVYRDIEKDEYAHSIGYKMLRIKYSVTNLRDIIALMSEYMGTVLQFDFKNNDPYKDIYDDNKIYEFYKTSDSTSTIEEFGISQTSLYRIIHEFGSTNKSELDAKRKNVAKYYETHTMKDTIDKFGYGRDYVLTSFKKYHNGKAKRSNHSGVVPVDQYTLSGEFVKTWPNTQAALDQLGKTLNISKCIHGKAKHAGGYVWRRAGEQF